MILICDNCNNTFERSQGQINATQKRGDKHRFCSPKCVGEFQKKQVELICKRCGKSFVRTRANTKGSKSGFFFCSSSCAAIFNNTHYKTPHKSTHDICPLCLSNKKTSSEICRVCAKNKQIEDNSNLLLGQVLGVGTNKYNKVRSHARLIIQSLPKECENCSYNKHVEACHRIEIGRFQLNTPLSIINHIGNLMVLCRNCHWEADNNLLLIKIDRFSDFDLISQGYLTPN